MLVINNLPPYYTSNEKEHKKITIINKSNKSKENKNHQNNFNENHLKVHINKKMTNALIIHKINFFDDDIHNLCYNSNKSVEKSKKIKEIERNIEILEKNKKNNKDFKNSPIETLPKSIMLKSKLPRINQNKESESPIFKIQKTELKNKKLSDKLNTSKQKNQNKSNIQNALDDSNSSPNIKISKPGNKPFIVF